MPSAESVGLGIVSVSPVPGGALHFYNLLQLRALTLTPDWVEVIGNSCTGETRWVRRMDLHFASWPEHLLIVVAVQIFDPDANPVRARALEDATVLAATSESLPPLAVSGDWLKVSISHLSDRMPPEGWVRWRRGDRLLVQQAEEYARSFGVDADVSTRPDGTQSVVVDRSAGGLDLKGGTNLDLPPGFPDDVPTYPQMNIVAAAALPTGVFSVQGMTADAPGRIAEFYRARMTDAGGTDDTPSEQSPVMRSLHFQKDARTVGVNLIPNNSGTMVQMMAQGAGG